MKNKKRILVTLSIFIIVIGINIVPAEEFGYNYLKSKLSIAPNLKILIKLTIESLKGEGNAFACIDENGTIYRSETICV